MNIILPKKYISVSQVNLWHSDRQKYINRYFLNLPEESSIYMDFGKAFATSTESYIKHGIIDENLPDFYLPKIQDLQGLEAEKEISLSINGVTVVGYIDCYSKDNNKVIDFKTSGKPWTIDTLKNSLQMKVYALSMFTNGEEIPVCQINWLGTKRIKDTIQFTGNSYEITHQFIMPELLQATEFIYETAKEIAKEYSIFTKKIIS